jgi:hypothetical protein
MYSNEYEIMMRSVIYISVIMKEHAQLITHVLFCVNHTNKSKIIDRYAKQHKKLT